METKIELSSQLDQSLEAFSSHLINQEESPALAALLDIAKNYSTEQFLRSYQQNGFKTIINFNDNGREKYFACLLLLAVIRNFKHVTEQLLQMGVDVNERLLCLSNPSDKYSGITALTLAALMHEDGHLVELLLRYEADITLLTVARTNVLFHLRSVNTYHAIRAVANKKDCFSNLLSQKDTDENSVFEFHCLFNRLPIINELLAIEDFSRYFPVRKCLHLTRLRTWIDAENRERYDEVCKRLRLMENHIFPFLKTLSNPTSSSLTEIYSTLFNHRPLFNTPNQYPSKKQALERVMAQITRLLHTPQSCVKYLEFLNQELIRYIELKHQTLPNLKDNKYTFQTINGLPYPIPQIDYEGFEKHSALQELLILLFKKYDLAKNSYKWIGYVSIEEAHHMLGQGDFITEERLGPGLLHGKLAHMLQQAIIIYAMEDNQFELAYQKEQEKQQLTIKDILYNCAWSKATTDNDWLRFPMFDRRYTNKIVFSDPHRLTSSLMYFGKTLRINILAEYLIDSFCKGLLKFLQALNSSQRMNLSMKEFIDHLNDLNAETFYPLENVMYLILEKEQQKGRFDVSSLNQLKYAIIPTQYQPNHSFVPAFFKDNLTNEIIYKAN